MKKKYFCVTQRQRYSRKGQSAKEVLAVERAICASVSGDGHQVSQVELPRVGNISSTVPPVGRLLKPA